MNVRSFLLQAVTVAAISCSATAMTDSGMGGDQQLERAINTALHLESSWHATIQLSDTPNRPITIAIPIDTVTYTMELEPHSVRSDIYSVFMQDDEGELYEVAPGPIRTLRGSITELAGSSVAGSLMEEGLIAHIVLADGTEFWMEPVGEKIDRGPSNLYAFYKTSDIIPSGGICAAADFMDVGRILEMQANYKPANANRGGFQIAQLGCDTDYEFYQDYGSSTESRINSIINTVNQQYESQVNLRHEITTIIVRSSSNDPYTTSNAGTFLDQFGNEWNSNQGSIIRDVAHLFTGKNLGGTIGIAWLGAVCYTPAAYSLVQSDCCNNYACTTDLSAHELGHNWGAGHCNCTSNTMNPYIVCANDFTQGSINSITSNGLGE